jgi:dTDP-4-amino-4,6-dideoxygalactose transaminase
MERIPFLKPNLVRKEAYQKYLAQIDESRLYSNYGPLNSLFERRVLEQYFQGEGALTTVNNATIGLMLAICHAKREGGRYALMPSFTFPATPLAAMWCGLEPYFIDIRDDDWCMNESILEETLGRLGDQAACVVTYAAFGTCSNLSRYEALHQDGIPVVIDAASSFGSASERGQFGLGFPGPVVFSFHATKSFGIGEGGLVYSGDEDLIRRIRQAGNFGFSADRISTMLGLNSKLSEYAAAVALATLDVFPEKRKIRQRIYQWYLEQFSRAGLFSLGWLPQKAHGEIPRQTASFLCPGGQSNLDHVARLADHRVESRTYFAPPCHKQPLFSAYPRSDMSVTEDISERVINFPTWEEMGEREVTKIVFLLAKS